VLEFPNGGTSSIGSCWVLGGLRTDLGAPQRLREKKRELKGGDEVLGPNS